MTTKSQVAKIAQDRRNARIAEMKKQLGSDKPQKQTVAPPVDVTLGERVGFLAVRAKRGIAKLGEAAVAVKAGVGEFADNVSTSYKFYDQHDQLVTGRK